MPKIEWNRPGDRIFETGLDRGVIYVEDGPAVPWIGLASVDDSGESTTKEYYLDGIKYLAVVTPRDWAGSVTAYTYPEEFGELIGISELGDGLYVDSQTPDRFNLSYRTMVSAPEVDKKPHYKIHLIYKAMASLSEFSNVSLGSETVPVEFSFDLTAVPVRIPGKRPSAHIILDSRNIDPEIMATIEEMLYGSDTQEPSFPTPTSLIDLLTFSDDVVVVYNGDGTWTATGSSANIKQTGNDGYFEIRNAPATFLSEDIYQFFGIESEAIWSVRFDDDGVPYFRWDEGSTNVGIDSDGTPFVEIGESSVSIFIDEDEVPYFGYH